jgi:hypothetical protein
MMLTPMRVSADVSLAHRVDRPLRDPRHEVLHQILKAVGDDVQGDQPEQDAADIVEVDRGARHSCVPGDKSFENLRGRQAENLRPQHAEDGADRARRHHHHEGGAVRPQVGEQPDQRPLEILRLLRRDAKPAHRPAAKHVARRRGARRLRRRRCSLWA